jgi:hypothetical protein
MEKGADWIIGGSLLFMGEFGTILHEMRPTNLSSWSSAFSVKKQACTLDKNLRCAIVIARLSWPSLTPFASKLELVFLDDWFKKNN